MGHFLPDSSSPKGCFEVPAPWTSRSTQALSGAKKAQAYYDGKLPTYWASLDEAGKAPPPPPDFLGLGALWVWFWASELNFQSLCLGLVGTSLPCLEPLKPIPLPITLAKDANAEGTQGWRAGKLHF